MAAVVKALNHTTFQTPSPDSTDSGVSIETFHIPNHRTVHGGVFPLGIRVKAGRAFKDIDAAVAHIESLAGVGIFDSLLAQRKTSGPDQGRTANRGPQTVLFFFAASPSKMHQTSPNLSERSNIHNFTAKLDWRGKEVP